LRPVHLRGPVCGGPAQGNYLAVRFETAIRSGVMALAIVGGGAAFVVMGVAAVSWRAQCENNPQSGVCFLSGTESRTYGIVARQAEPAPVPQFSAETAAEQVVAAVAPAPETVAPVMTLPKAVESAAAAVPSIPDAETTVAELPAPVEPAAPEGAAVGAMMVSTFETLSALKAKINGDDPAPDPLQAAVVAAVAPPQPYQAVPPAGDASAEDPTAAASIDTALPTPAPLAPDTRVVKLIPVGPNGAPIMTPATAAIDAAEQDQPRAVALAQPAADSADALAFANNPGAIPVAEDARLLEVQDNLVNVRAAASTESKRLFVLEEGDEVKALAVSGAWIQIEDDRGRSGWMLGEFLGPAGDDSETTTQVAAVAPRTEADPVPPQAPAEEIAEAVESSNDVRRVLGQGVNVRSGASTSSEKLFALAPGEQITVHDNSRGWLKITDDQGRTGWVYKDFVSGG
jgi:uncharacterized protein YgiM (DUF1202 family)